MKNERFLRISGWYQENPKSSVYVFNMKKDMFGKRSHEQKNVSGSPEMAEVRF